MGNVTARCSLWQQGTLSPHKCYGRTGRVFAKERVKSAKKVKSHPLLPVTVLPKTESPEGRYCVKTGAASLSDREWIDRFWIYILKTPN